VPIACLPWALVTSLSAPTDLVSTSPHFFPPHVTFEHYRQLLGATSSFQGSAVQSVWPQFSRALVNSLLTSLLATVVTVVSGSSLESGMLECERIAFVRMGQCDGRREH
jgi:ABC-type glycerol-3-phosphate transport system permease component